MIRFAALAAFFIGATNAAAQDADCSVAEFTAGLKFQQKSAEIAALQLQAFNLATLRLDAAVKGAEDPKKLAVVTDLDETVIDNTALLARDLKNCHRYDNWDTWRHWERDGEPTLIPGAKAFLDHADELGVTIAYISDRTDDQKEFTLKTLQALELPQVSADTVQLLGPDKTERRANVSKDHEIVLLLGDSLPDFDGGFAEGSVAERRQLVEEKAAEFGDKWIVFPNAAYGSWRKAELDAWDAEEKLEDY
ncbi:5'-nucleotidase [Fulvimarina endophytica]|uniref:5'-nucleotidase n=1 Tax=Fulvimarina endophytica TaxID=2293836 RepID=A0A371X0U6_9HYPH|nr:HAD family acid phosphatase [Fulvimarina endophytica]RFC62836.1 5'-nucleotidase [Fulvimarina endophytica]